MIMAACALLALGVVAFLISPLLDQRLRQAGGKIEVEDLQKKKDFLYASIRELNIDHRMGKLSDEDHRQLQTEYLEEASRLMERLDRATNGKRDAATLIEHDILTIRKRRGTSTPVVAARPVGIPDSHTTEREAPVVATCTHCGTDNEADARFCMECGTALEVLACSACGTSYKPGSKFCSQCGQRV